MSIHVALHHVTHYRYDKPVNMGAHVVRLRPAPHCRTNILSYSLKISPADHFLNWQQDPQANYVGRLVFPNPATEFRVEVDLVAEMSVYNPFDFFLEPEAEHLPFRYHPALDNELESFRKMLPVSPYFGEYLMKVRDELYFQKPPPSGFTHAHTEVAVDIHTHGVMPEFPLKGSTGKSGVRPRTIDFLVALNQRLWQDISYLVRLEPGVQTPEETLRLGSGSCRDSAWLLCQLLRHLGFAARFVSGYLIQLKPDQKSLDGPSGAEEDFTDLHAWCEVYLPGAGWVGLDPTSGLLAGEGHIPLAATPDPSSAAPIDGALDPCEVTFDFEMTLTRIKESPRVTKPYTDEQWAAIEALGHDIDARLKQGDVRLTMGGEPTFVSMDDVDGIEWNMAALGEKKRILSGELIKRLRERFGPGGLLHYGQGKWYPGEPLPRWALACVWRKDGEPVWKDDALIADESRNYGHQEADARRFAQLLAAALGVDTRHLMPAYEDVYYYLWKERRLPSNVNPLESNLKNEQDRDRLARIFEKGLGAITGFALPLTKEEPEHGGHWKSGPWFMRNETLYLIPGDSPMGYRLPLDSLPWVDEKEFPWLHQQDPMDQLPPLPSRPAEIRHYLRPMAETLLSMEKGPQRLGNATGGMAMNGPGDSTGQKQDARTIRPAHGQSAPWIIRTAICFETRQGRLHIFLPPVPKTEDFLELIAAIEETAASLQMPIIIEGEPPPRDPRLRVLKVTPDPGVIEVNLQPCDTWQELADTTTILYDEARQTRLTTEKFMLDGRHTGTGGGNHIVLGGETPADSPFLRRPDLLRSLLGYWQNHPSLSFLFSGLFIGPTSQHPRIDEAREDALYELEMAFRQIPDNGPVAPWLVDRIFRNLLVDSTGNTHRTEFCIDKLFSPDGPGGRLGLVELRSFEMPPHARMSLAQQLLLRACVARFWDEPYRVPLVRWGTEIHDRFMLPHFVWQDFEDVITDFQDAGFGLEEEWFAPHAEFRFPLIGSFGHRGLWVELRGALEPWHVLGEENSGGGTVRYVDSSLERLQIKINGWTDPRFVITCNGKSIPLHPTGTRGEFVAGIRYRAWQPPGCLHPTIGIHTPLTFDIVDTWNQRSLGGAMFHVTHPGGRSYDTFPVNSFEAESRRLSRFFPMGHTPGQMNPPPPRRSREFPMTLDMRATAPSDL